MINGYNKEYFQNHKQSFLRKSAPLLLTIPGIPSQTLHVNDEFPVCFDDIEVYAIVRNIHNDGHFAWCELKPNHKYQPVAANKYTREHLYDELLRRIHPEMLPFLLPIRSFEYVTNRFGKIVSRLQKREGIMFRILDNGLMPYLSVYFKLALTPEAYQIESNSNDDELYYA